MEVAGAVAWATPNAADSLYWNFSAGSSVKALLRAPDRGWMTPGEGLAVSTTEGSDSLVTVSGEGGGGGV